MASLRMDVFAGQSLSNWESKANKQITVSQLYHGFIRPDNLVFHSLNVFKVLFANCKQV